MPAWVVVVRHSGYRLPQLELLRFVVPLDHVVELVLVLAADPLLGLLSHLQTGPRLGPFRSLLHNRRRNLRHGQDPPSMPK